METTHGRRTANEQFVNLIFLKKVVKSSSILSIKYSINAIIMIFKRLVIS
jgi:hypothetical protein